MKICDVQIKKLHPDAILPSYKKPGDSGFDLYAVEDIEIVAGEVQIVPTGLAFAVPEGYEMQLRMRSGASLHTPLIMPNAPATIDSGYRGEVGIILRNVGTESYLVHKGERLVQGVIAPVIQANLVVSEELPESERGANGYGSTGVN